MGISQSKTQEFKQYLENEMLESIYPKPYAQEIKTPCTRPMKPALQCTIEKVLDANPIQRKNENVVNADDHRIQIQNTNKWPYSVHGVVTSKFNNDTCYGTGILIGPNIVLTAGHNLYHYEYKVYANLQSIQFLPGMNGQMLPFGFVEVEKYFVSPNYIEKAKEDYGILILKKPIGEITGYFGLACLEQKEIQSKTINVTGYPRDKEALKPKTYEMWGMEGTVSHIDQGEGLINYVIDTGPGQSGSGVWYQEGENYYICAVHVSGGHSVNSATLLTKAIYEKIYTWMQESSFNELLFKLKNSKKLDFREKRITAECIALLMNYKLEDLTILDFYWTRIDAEGAKALAQNTSWTNLLQLKLPSNDIGAEGAKALAQNTSWTNLSVLNLYWNNLGTQGAEALAQNTSWINLSKLNLEGNNIGAEGAKALAQNTSWTNLSVLNLGENDINAKGAKALAQNISWTNLSHLNLSFNNIGADGAKALAQNTSWINLSVLNLYWNDLGTQGVEALAQNTSWTNLSVLNLGENDINEKGAKALAQNTSWINLSELSFYWNNIGAEGAKGLAQNTSWIKLSKLDLRINNIGEEEVKLLRQNKAWKKNIEISLYPSGILNFS